MSPTLQNARLESLTQQGGLIDQFVDSIASDGRDRCETAVAMLVALKAFARSMATFFEQGFSGQTPKLEYRNVTPDYVYSLLSEQVSYDLDAILRAYHQRHLVNGSAAARSNAGITIRNGADADKLAYSILTAAMQGGIGIRAATVFTYFQKSLRIRLLPYVRVAFIGVPYSALSSQSDWLALAHEIGHFVYRNSIISQDPNTIKELCKEPATKWYSSWLEEIVADVFGCMIAGPSIAASMQDLSLQTRIDEMGDNDGRHPAPVLRPYIYIDTLTQLGKFWGNVDLSEVANRLKTKWEGHFDPSWLQFANVHLPGDSNTQSISVDEARTKINNEVIEQLIPLAKPYISASSIESGLARLVKWLTPESTADCYLFRKLWGTPAQWAVMVDPFQAPAPRDLNLFDGSSAPSEPRYDSSNGKITVDGPSDGPSVAPETLELGETKTAFDFLKATYEYPDPPCYTESKWTELLEFGGWIEQGPSGGTAH